MWISLLLLAQPLDASNALLALAHSAVDRVVVHRVHKQDVLCVHQVNARGGLFQRKDHDVGIRRHRAEFMLLGPASTYNHRFGCGTCAVPPCSSRVLRVGRRHSLNLHLFGVLFVLLSVLSRGLSKDLLHFCLVFFGEVRVILAPILTIVERRVSADKVKE